MAIIDYPRITSALNQSKFQKENNALYQSILGIINGTRKKEESDEQRFINIQNFLNALRPTVVIEWDTGVSVNNYILDDYIFTPNMYIFKDIGGNASVNNITFTGNVDGVAALPINTDYGIARIYKSITDGNYYSW